MNPIFLLLQSLFNTGTSKSEPVRLQKKSTKRELKINKNTELVILSVAMIIVIVCLLLILIPSCTDSGLIYNNHLL